MRSTVSAAGLSRPLRSRRPAAVLAPVERASRIPAGLPILLGVLGFVIWLAMSVVLVRSLIIWWADLEISAFQSGYAAYLQ
jgi:hypothetical protein